MSKTIDEIMFEIAEVYARYKLPDVVSVEKTIIGQSLDFPILALYTFKTEGGEDRVARENYMFAQFL